MQSRRQTLRRTNPAGETPQPELSHRISNLQQHQTATPRRLCKRLGRAGGGAALTARIVLLLLGGREGRVGLGLLLETDGCSVSTLMRWGECEWSCNQRGGWREGGGGG